MWPKNALSRAVSLAGSKRSSVTCCRLEPLFWEHEPLLATASFQEQMPRPSEADIAIVILWSRIGTALPGHIQRPDGSLYSSGTEFEFEDAIDGFRRNGKPELLVYRKTAAPAWPAEEELAAQRVAQKLALDRFITKWFVDRESGAFTAAFHSFESPADFEELLEAHLTRIIGRILGSMELARPATKPWHQGSPFRGLETFGPEHAPIFFGRTAAIASVLMKLRRQAERGTAFVLIMGMSGGGKSSLARAGVLPLMLHPGVLGRAREWRYAIFRPSEGHGDLASALVNALAQPSALPDLPGPTPPSTSGSAHRCFRCRDRSRNTSLHGSNMTRPVAGSPHRQQHAFVISRSLLISWRRSFPTIGSTIDNASASRPRSTSSRALAASGSWPRCAAICIPG